MKIASIRKGENETYGLVQDDKIATKDDITSVSYTHLTLPTKRIV